MNACSTRRGANPRRLPHSPPLVALLTALALAVAGQLPADRARADTAPLDPSDPRTPVTVSADSLPTAQINGVAWQQVVVGRTVYVVGSFSTARPAGAKPGEQTRVRRNILAYDLHTGALSTSFRPSLNGEARTVTASPDGSRLYVGGDFTRVDGAPAHRIVALRTRTGARIASFRASVNAVVNAVVTRGSRVWFGGGFDRVNGRQRWSLAAVDARNGRLLPWAPRAEGQVRAMAVSPTGRKVAAGGTFTSLNGSRRPGFGLGMVDSRTGRLRPFRANRVIRNGGRYSGITALTSDGERLYGTGFKFGPVGNFEGAFSARWSDGRLRWLEDCHGDSLGIFPSRSAVYVVGHPHTCRNIGGFPETEPTTVKRAIAFSREATTVIAKEPSKKYHNFEGLPAPSLLTWFPEVDFGRYTGHGQGAWHVTGTRDYVLLAGEFRHVNGLRQQGLARFAVSEKAPNLLGPVQETFWPRLESPEQGTVKVTWKANHDPDNSALTYRVFRDKATEPIAELVAESTFWRRPVVRYRDSGLTPGWHTYHVTVTDPFGNARQSETVGINLP